MSGGGASRLFEDSLLDVAREGHVGILGCPLDQRGNERDSYRVTNLALVAAMAASLM